MPAAIVSSIACRPSLRGGDLDEQVRAVDQRVQALGLVDRGLGVVREVRVDLERDPAVLAVALVPDGAQDVAGVADVVRGEREKISLGSRLAAGDELADLVVVGVALGDRALEDRRVGGDAHDALVDQAGEVAVLDEGARQVVDPDALAVLGQLLERGLGHGAPFWVGSSQTGCTTEPCPRATAGANGTPRRRRSATAARRARAARPRRPARCSAPRAAGRRAPGWR